MNHWELEFLVIPWQTNGLPDQGFLVSENQVTLLGDGKRFDALATITFDRCAGLEVAVAVVSTELRNSAAQAVKPRPKRPRPQPGELEEISVCTDGVAYDISLSGAITLHGHSCRGESFIEPGLNALQLARACLAANRSLKGDVAQAARP